VTVGVVVATRNRRTTLLRTLDHLAALPGRPPVVVVDNGSSDATLDAVRGRHPRVRLLELGENLGAAARNRGVEALDAPLVAFCDDDSWWWKGALEQAEEIFDAHPGVALVAGRVLFGADRRLDPTSAAMARSPLPQLGALPRVLGFLACAAVVRRRAFLEAGGFHGRLGVGGEEELLAIDLRRRGWDLVYAENAVAEHQPPPRSRSSERIRRQLRNALWVSWLRRGAPSALSASARVLASARPRDATSALAMALGGAGWVLRERRPVPADLERELALVGRD
jgi:GT2 family glycosyltransferase